MPRLAVVGAVVAMLCASCGPATHRNAATNSPAPVASAADTSSSATLAPTSSTAAAVTTTTADPAALPQTGTQPTADAQFAEEMALLWQAVTSGQAAIAAPAFFPEGAYVQLKALYNDRADWTDRLLAHLALDVGAAHRLLGAGAASAQLVAVNVGAARWIPPGVCSNRIGYWYTPGARVVYRLDGIVRSFGIAALDGWRGEWYVVHLGAEVPPAGRGVVDAPSIGTGIPGHGSGC